MIEDSYNWSLHPPLPPFVRVVTYSNFTKKKFPMSAMLDKWQYVMLNWYLACRTKEINSECFFYEFIKTIGIWNLYKKNAGLWRIDPIFHILSKKTESPRKFFQGKRTGNSIFVSLIAAKISRKICTRFTTYWHSNYSIVLV